MVKWDNSVLRMKEIAERDGTISYPDVVNIIRSTLDRGGITVTERDNLQRIANRSTSHRAKRLIYLFNEALREHSMASGKLKLPAIAANRVCDFLMKSDPGKFPGLDRDEVGVGLIMRLANPGIINQGRGSLCGPAAMLFSLATHDPVQYAVFATDLYDQGRARLGKLDIRPGSDCRNYRPPAGSIPPVEWLTAASIRDSENWFFDYDSVGDAFAGITLPGELASWFKSAGFRDVRNETNLVIDKGRQTLVEVKKLFQRGYRICLFVGINMLYSHKKHDGTWTAQHWVVLTDLQSITGNIRMEVFTWGKGKYQVPAGGPPLSESAFYDNFYGYVAGRP